jgi:hypothetical protein
MLDIVGPVVAVLGTAVIAAGGWVSKRLSREGRLVLRIERLGSAYSALPESPEKKELEGHLLQAAAKLNDWLDEDARIVRWIQRVAMGLAAIVGAWLSSRIAPSIPNPVVLSVASFGIGCALGVLILVVMALAHRVQMKRSRGRERERMRERYAAIERGEIPAN